MNQQQPHSDADNNSRWANGCHWLAWLGLLLALVYVVASYGQELTRYRILHNSDTAFIPLFYRDVLARGTIEGWDLPTNPYLVPDMALFIPLDLLLNNINLSVILYGVLQLLLTVVGLLLLQRQLFGAARLPQTLMLLTMTLCVLFLATWNHLFTYLPLMTSHHFGVLVMLPFATVALLRALQPTRSAKQQRRATIVLFVLTLLMALSDSLFIIQFVLPALFALLLWGKSKDTTWRQLLLLGGVLLLAAAAGQWLRQWLVPVSKLLLYTELEDQTIISESIERLGEWTVEVATKDPLFVLYWLSSLFALVAATVIAIVHLKKWSGARRFVLVATLLLASLPLSVVAAIATGNVDGDSSARYILPTLFLPLFCGWPFLLALWTTNADAQSAAPVKPTRWVTVVSSIVAIVFIGYMLVTVQPAALAAVPGYQDPFVACLERETEQRNLHYGLAEFWQAHYTSALSRGKLHIATATSTLSPYLWNANRHHYQHPFEFVVINSTAPSVWRIRKEFLVERFGPPVEIFECEGNPVYVYDPATNVQLQEWFEHHSDLVTLTDVGDEIELFGYTLPSPIGGVSIGLSQGASEEWDQEPGMLAYVPLLGIPAGSYAVAIDLFTDNAESGEWEVISLTANGAEMIVREPITATGQSTIRGHFDLKEEGDVDIGVKYDGNGLLYVDKIRIARVDPAEAATYEFASSPSSVDASTDASAPGSLTLIAPYAESTIDQPQVDFVWQWTGEPLPKEQTFEVRLWKRGEAIHYGAHDAVLGRELIRQIGNTYTLRLDPGGAYSVIKNGAGEYEWTVAIVAVEPTYQEMHIEATPQPLRVQR